ncbi:MAG: hypothetical protein KGM49_06245 [Sphingomonadales bacterium]|nr:hypothetical protein [Sphingomonadales bacterium]
MFIGHWAPALVVASKKSRPGLGTLFVAAQLIDWAFFAFLLTGAEHMRMTPGVSVMNPMDLYDMPYTHSLLGSLVFAVAFGGIVMAVTRDRTAGLLTGAVVLSHWLLDLLVHVPDLTLAGSPPKLGLGLWNHPAIEMPLELGITFGALWLYARNRQPSPLRVVVLGVIMLALQMVNWFGPVAETVTIGTSLLAFFAYGLATLAGWWMGKSAPPSV